VLGPGLTVRLTLPHGRPLAYEVTGDRAGSPVVALHGTPGSSRQKIRHRSRQALTRPLPGV